MIPPGWCHGHDSCVYRRLFWQKVGKSVSQYEADGSKAALRVASYTLANHVLCRRRDVMYLK
jgi:hypothetical protein